MKCGGPRLTFLPYRMVAGHRTARLGRFFRKALRHNRIIPTIRAIRKAPPGAVRAASPAFTSRAYFCPKQADFILTAAGTTMKLHIRRPVMLGTILLVVLIIALVGALPTWRYSNGWGYYPSGGLGAVLLVLIILMLLGRI